MEDLLPESLGSVFLTLKCMCVRLREAGVVAWAKKDEWMFVL